MAPSGKRENTFPDRPKANIMRERVASSLRTEMSDNGKRGEEGPGTGVVVKAKPKTKKPSMYKVLMLNDDYTPMEFVVHILERFFNKNRQEATRIMLHVHRRGVGICGVYTYEVAETKVTQVMDFARQHQHPLQCTLEKD
jgi:ATP-dependent Clp protease adaptor protein ClpS